MDMIPVKSDNIESLGYDDIKECLYVKFSNKKQYLYKDVNMTTFAELLFSKVKSQYLQQNIFDKYEKIAV